MAVSPGIPVGRFNYGPIYFKPMEEIFWRGY